MTKPITILYVDDYPLDRELVRDVLEKEDGGFRIIEAASRAEFETRLAEGSYDLVLSDFNILGFDGLQVLDIVRAEKGPLPVVILTGTGSEEVAVEAMKRGAADYVIKKPHHIQRLPLTLRAVLDRVRAEEALHQQYSTLRGIINSVDALVFSVDRQCCYTSFNQAHAAAMKTLYGAEIEMGRSLLDYMTVTEDRETAKRNLERALAGEQLVEEAYSGEELRLRRYFRVSHNPIKTEAGQVIGVAVLVQDMTERKRAEETLQDSERRLAESQRLAHIGSWELNLVNNVLRWSDEIYRIFEIDPQKFGATYEAFLGAIHPDDREAVNFAYTNSLQTKTPYAIDHRLLFADGRIKYVHEQCETFYEGDTPIRSIGTVQDITERKQAEEALHRLNRELRAISDCNQVLVRAEDEQALLNDICRIVCDGAGYRMAWVGYAEADEAKTVRPVAWAGVEDGYLAAANIAWADTERGWGPTGAAIRTGKSACIQDFTTDPRAAPWRESALSRGYRSSIALPLKDETGITFGTFNIYSTEPNVFTPDEIQLLEELAGDLAYGVTTLRIRAEHKKAEMQVLASEHLFRALVENSPDFIARYDREFRRVYVNPAIQKLFGKPAEEVLNKAPDDQSPVYAPQTYIDHLQRVIETATESDVEMPFRTAQGEMHWGHMRFVPEFGPDGQVASVLAIGRDIHEIKEKERHFRMLAENFPDLVVRYDRDIRLTYVNPAIEKAVGMPTGAFLGKTLQELTQGYLPEKNKALLALIHRTFDEGVINDTEVFFDTPSGWRTFEVRHVPEKDATGNIVAVLGIARDITERKQAEEEIRRLNQELEQRVANRTAQLEAANRELEAFAYSVSHDLRAPLRHIDGYLELLQQRVAGTLDERSQYYMANVFDSVRRMGHLIDDLLTFSRMGRHDLSKTSVELDALVQEVIRELEPEIQGRTINWHIAALPTVDGDRAMLRQVLVNLVSNALKFTRGCAQVDIEIGCQTGEKETIIFIRDNGVGFDMAYADKLFGVFQRLHQADEFEGTGIGLANVRRIVSRHGGRTWAKGEVDRGATFYFSLPQPIKKLNS